VKARKPSAEESGFSLTRLEFFFKCSHKVIVALTMLLPIVHLIWIRHPIISWKRVVSMTVDVVSLTISDIFTGVESVSTGVKTVSTGVEMTLFPIFAPSREKILPSHTV
jgi:hypothetical protein